MRLALAGINHRTAPVQIREKLALRPEDIPSALLDLQASGAKEVLFLSTCNRVEVTATLSDSFSVDQLVERLIPSHSGLSVEFIRPHLYLYEGAEAIRHLFRVASSLDSMIVGEPQILGQLKQAYHQAREQGTIGTVLDTVLARAFSVAKRIRSETDIGQNAVSVSYAAIELAKEIFGSLKGKSVLIIGAGKMSESAARHLLRAGVAKILVTNRTPQRAKQMAEAFRGEIVPYETFPQRLSEVDIVVASSGASNYVITGDIMQRVIEERRNRPMFLIDIAVPRNIEPTVNRIEHAFLYDIDDLQRLAERNLQTRREVAQQAENIISEEVARLESRLRTRDITPTILNLQEQLEAIRQEVLLRYRGRLGTLTPEQEEAIEGLTRGIVNKIAHGPISEIRRHAKAQASESNPQGEVISAVRRMFGLRDY